MRWSPDGRFLASGGNDNLLNIWPQLYGQLYSRGQPLHVFNAHQAAVKALAWCPWQPGVLASGGGTADRCIRIWNANSGTLLNTTDTKSQVRHRKILEQCIYYSIFICSRKSFHHCIFFLFEGLRFAMVCSLQRNDFGPWLRKQSTDDMEVSFHEQSS